MNKRILVMGILLTFLFLLVGCDTQTTTTTTSSETTTTTTSGVSVVTSNTAVALADSIPSDCAITTVEDGWVPVWCDEFQYTGGVDLSKWSVVVGGGGFGNNELQYYTNRQENLYVDGEYLNITALMENYGGYNYTSAKIWTTNTETWKYGKFEMRAKLPAGRGTWPAFWMMPASSKYGGWPDSGEIDIMEHVGYDMNVVHGTIHTDRFNGSNGRGGSTSILLTEGLVTSIDVANEFHTYGIEWDETSITWFYDGLAFASVGYDPELSGTVLYDTTVDWPFDQYFYLILNLAIGGNWGGAQGVDNNIFPTTMQVDYVRVYQHDNVYQDSGAPSSPSNASVIRTTSNSVYLVWNEAVDDHDIKQYYIYVGALGSTGTLIKKTGVNGALITGLPSGVDVVVTIVAEDYVGNQSVPLQVLVTTLES